jgi:hypothetical protein
MHKMHKKLFLNSVIVATYHDHTLQVTIGSFSLEHMIQIRNDTADFTTMAAVQLEP